MRDRFSDIFKEPPTPRRTNWLRLLLGIFYKVVIFALGIFPLLLMGVLLLVPVMFFLVQSIDPYRPPRVPHAERVGHAHGLVIDPADGALYVASIRGLYWIKNPEWAERVTDSYQDSRGIIALGPGEFLAGGRPDIRDRVSGFAPPYSGLIRSQDAGKKWRDVSLSGEAEFHTLEVKGGAIFAWDNVSLGFMVSREGGKTWETRSHLDQVVDFAVNPADANQVYATAEGDFLASRDGGRSWQALSTRRLPQIAWPDAGHLWGVDEEGGVYLSQDAGASWQRQGVLAGPAEAFLAAPSGLYAAAYDDAAGVVIYTSADGGQSWQELYRDPPLSVD